MGIVPNTSVYFYPDRTAVFGAGFSCVFLFYLQFQQFAVYRAELIGFPIHVVFSFF
jgi:hypothetical protein